MAQILVCKNCKKGVFESTSGSTLPVCPHCSEDSLRMVEDWEEFRCIVCDYTLDAMTLKMHGNLHRIPEGLLRCKYDDQLMELV